MSTSAQPTEGDQPALPHCQLCLAEPDDWCPACASLLCPEHSCYHRGDYDEPCRQIGPDLEPGWVEHAIGLEVDALDRAGVAVGLLGLTDDRFRAVFRCIDCRRVFTVTGPPSVHFGIGCLGDACSTYDIARDVDVFFEPAFEAGIIRREAK